MTQWTLGHGTGKPDAPIFVVGEAWGEEEEKRGTPFVGRSGEELGRMLHDAGLLRSECFITNVVNARPPGNDIKLWLPETKSKVTAGMVPLNGRHCAPILKAGYDALLKELSLVRPKIIVALGNTPLWALCGRSGISRWRGSLLNGPGGIRLVPTYHPAAILRMWEWRAIAVHDLRRVANELASPTPEPTYHFLVAPTLDEVLSTLNMLWNRARILDQEVWLDFDIETVRGHIRCFALSWSRTEALCVPLITHEKPRGYWTPEEEGTILWHLYKLMTSPNVRVRGQNLLYDFQYCYKHWHFIPNLGQDAMLTHHVCWSGMPKALGFQASMYCDHYVNWKGMVQHNEEKEGA